MPTQTVEPAPADPTTPDRPRIEDHQHEATPGAPTWNAHDGGPGGPSTWARCEHCAQAFPVDQPGICHTRWHPAMTAHLRALGLV